MPFNVKLEVFEGPFDLLLHLISRKEIDIYEISLSDITAEYLDYLQAMHDLDLDVATEFLLIAAILIKLKSDGLLPAAEPEPERMTPFETREELVWRLIEYRKFKNAAEDLLSRIDAEDAFFYREVEFEDSFIDLMPHLLAGLTAQDLADAFSALQQEEGQVDVSFIAPIKINIQDFIDRIRAALQTRPRITFRELTGDIARRIELIATFMAMLEMYKRDEIDIDQSERFGDIELVRTDTAAAVAGEATRNANWEVEDG